MEGEDQEIIHSGNLGFDFIKFFAPDTIRYESSGVRVTSIFMPDEILENPEMAIESSAEASDSGYLRRMFEEYGEPVNENLPQSLLEFNKPNPFIGVVVTEETVIPDLLKEFADLEK
jgi:hypothetical protein